jgi:hypothetical protein
LKLHKILRKTTDASGLPSKNCLQLHTREQEWDPPSPEFPTCANILITLINVVYDNSRPCWTIAKESARKEETAKTTITEPPSNEEFREHRRWKRKPPDDAETRTKKPATSATGVNDPQLQSKPEFPPGNCLPH